MERSETNRFLGSVWRRGKRRKGEGERRMMMMTKMTRNKKNYVPL
jgi:hypothetical protein